MGLFDTYEVLSFDVYGTLIDFESGILGALKPVLKAHGVDLSDEQILAAYGEIEAQIQRGTFSAYRRVLRKVVEEFGGRFEFIPSSSERGCLVNSLGTWLPFPDVVDSLHTLKKHFRLAIISNIDDTLFSLSAPHLEVAFDWVVTSEQTHSYKPSLRNFKFALEEFGVPCEQVLHIACSMYHDIIPAKALGLSAVWVNRRSYIAGLGVVPPMGCSPDFEVPDLNVLISTMGLNTVKEGGFRIKKV